MTVLRFLRVDVASGSARLLEAGMPGVLGPVDYGVKLHMEARSYGYPVFSPRNLVVAGCGPFAGSRVFGAHRMALVFRSPVTRGLHVSTVGGVCYRFIATSVHGIVVEGWREEPVVIVVKGKARGSIEARVEEIGWETLWTIWRGYKGFRGTRALAAYLLEQYGKELPQAGVLVVGPAAARTIMAGVFSFNVEHGRPGGVVDSASRGGAGSVLLQGHGVAAIVYGGEYDMSRDNPRLRDTRLLDELSRRVMGKSYIGAVEQATVKYRYDPRLGTGGTFGVNYIHYRDLLPFFGFNTVYLSKAARSKLVNIVLEELWKPVQRDVFEQSGAKPWRTCGEPCPAACKKLWRGVKIDYEPSNALGPFSGVLRAEDMVSLVELADELGVDAIEAGHIVAWLFDLLQRGMLSPSDLGLQGHPVFDPLVYRVEHDSRANAEAARRILKGLVEQRGWLLSLIATRGLRAAAHVLNLRYSGRVYMYRTGYQDVAVYSAYGGQGYMTPNLYWSPGLVAPVPVPGRYWTVYSPSFASPEELAEAVLDRMIAEYLVDNAGLCRFHRRWVERLLEHLYHELLGLEVDLRKHALETLRAIARYQILAGAEPRPWESRKTVDMIAGIALELGDREWGPRIAEDPVSAREWWSRFREKLWGLLGLGGEEAGG